jgi:hypothetical protein
MTLRLCLESIFFTFFFQIIIDKLVPPVGCSRELINEELVVKVTIEVESDNRGRDVMDLNNVMLLLPDQDIIF